MAVSCDKGVATNLLIVPHAQLLVFNPVWLFGRQA